MICIANQQTGFYMSETWVLNDDLFVASSKMTEKKQSLY